MISLPEFLKMVRDLETAVACRENATSGVERRVHKEAADKARNELNNQIMSLY